MDETEIDATGTMCMINGDFNLTNGSCRSISLKDIDGVYRNDMFMRYDSQIAVTDTRMIGHISEEHNLLVDVYIPVRHIVDRPRDVSVSLHGRLYLPNYELDLDGTGDQPNNGRIDNNPIIEVVAFKHYFFLTPDETIPRSLFVRPAVMMIGKVASITERHPLAPHWCTVDVVSSTYIKSVQRQMRIQILLKGFLTAWRLQEQSSVFILGQFIVGRGENVASLRAQYINVLSGGAPEFVLPLPSLGGNLWSMYSNAIDFSDVNGNNEIPGAEDASGTGGAQPGGIGSVNSGTNETEREDKKNVLSSITEPSTETSTSSKGDLTLPGGSGGINITINYNFGK